VNNVFAANASPFIDDKENKIKEKAILRIIMNSHHNLKDALNKWKNQSEIIGMRDALTNEKKKALLDSLNQFLGNSLTSRLRMVLLKFHENAKIGSVQDRFFKRLLATKAGGYVNSFAKWKALPERKDNELYKLGNAFEKHLSKLV
jgi:hypothetical protein